MQLSKCFHGYRVKRRRPEVKLTYLSSWSAHTVSLSPSHASAASSDKYADYFLKTKDSEVKYSRRSTQEKKCVLPVNQNGGQKAVFAHAYVHLSTNKCRVSRNLRFPWEEKSRSVLIEPDALHPFRDTQKRREKKKSKDETKPSRKKGKNIMFKRKETLKSKGRCSDRRAQQLLRISPHQTLGVPREKVGLSVHTHTYS